jgi:signal transduction histidine kinase
VTARPRAGSYFAARTPHERLLMTDCYMAVTAISMLTLAAALAERRSAIGARDEFISIASHELKTPLTALKLRLTAAIRTQAPRRRATRRRKRSWARRWPPPDDHRPLVSLVDDLLDASRLTAGRLALHIEACRCPIWSRRCGPPARPGGEAGSHIEVSIPEPIVGRWDRIRIEQIVTNLLSNAIKYGAASRSGCRPTRSGACALDVKDAGGDLARRSGRIFQAFERVTTAAASAAWASVSTSGGRSRSRTAGRCRWTASRATARRSRWSCRWRRAGVRRYFAAVERPELRFGRFDPALLARALLERQVSLERAPRVGGATQVLQRTAQAVVRIRIAGFSLM